MAERSIHKSGATTKTLALTYKSAGLAEITSRDIEGEITGKAVIQTLFSGISRGTENLVFKGKIPVSEWQNMRCPHQYGEFSFPVSYGYQLVGKIIEIDNYVINLEVGHTVFLLHPHQSIALVETDWLNKVPDSVPPRRAVLAANVETALNAVWDSRISKENRACVIGAGVVGLLTASLAAKESGHPITIFDTDERKRDVAERLGLIFRTPDQADEGYDIIFHTSANGAGLQSAINMATFEGRIVEMSWYGDKQVTLNLGGPFHSKRLQIISSQVGHVSPSRRKTTTHKDRMAEALHLLHDEKFDCLLEEDIAFNDLPSQLDRIFHPNANILCQVVRYDDTQHGE